MKKNNFTIIHIIAAYMVLVGHQFILMGQGPLVLFGIDLHGLGVRVLFLVSGYLVSASYLRSKNPFHFWWKRISRLYPPLAVCLIVTVLVMRLVTESPEYYWQSAVQYILHNVEMRPKFDLAGVFVSNPYQYAVNGSLWTLPLEIACYFLLVPFLEIYKLIKKKSVVCSAAYMVLPVFAVSCFDFWKIKYGNGVSVVLWGTEWLNMSYLGTYFLFGVAVSILDLKKFCNMQVSVLLVVLYSCMTPDVKYFITPYVVSYAVLSFALVENPMFDKCIKKDICYGIYLYAFPVQQILIYIISVKHGIQVSPFILCLPAIVLTTAFAVLNSLIIEDTGWIKALISLKNGKADNK